MDEGVPDAKPADVDTEDDQGSQASGEGQAARSDPGVEDSVQLVRRQSGTGLVAVHHGSLTDLTALVMRGGVVDDANSHNTSQSPFCELHTRTRNLIDLMHGRHGLKEWIITQWRE